MTPLTTDLILKTKRGVPLSRDEIFFLVNGFTRGEIPEYQIAAWLMAVNFKGLTSQEIATLTESMRDSGSVMKWNSQLPPRVDKHSTGGVGDKTTLVLAPIVAAAGLSVPMIAGRGLGHTGGTLDKLESIPGFSVNLNTSEFINHVSKSRLSIIGQTAEICPADKKLYALRDVTGTVDSIPLICASIMSKKLAEGLNALVLDVKVGSGAFMKSFSMARELAIQLKAAGELNGLKVTAFLTSMDQPLGRFMGNAAEVIECVDILQNKTSVHGGVDLYEDTRELSVLLAGEMIFLGGQSATPEAGVQKARALLKDGSAYREFGKLCERQGGSGWTDLKMGAENFEICANAAGFIQTMDTEKIGLAGILLGTGRKTVQDKVDLSAGMEFLKKVGDRVEKGEPFLKLFGQNRRLFSDVERALRASISIAPSSLTKIKLVQETLRG